MKIFFDTNVLASALTTRGLCWDLFGHVVDNHTLLTSEAVLKELQQILIKQFGVPDAMARQSNRELRVLAAIVPESQHNLVQLSDPDDGPIVSSAATANAALFVTGDKVVLAQHAWADMQILSPRQCWERLREDA